MSKHLWEIKHDYYCEDRDELYYDSWIAFLESMNDIDYDLNLIFRFDWCINDKGENKLFLYYVLQRKGIVRTDVINVNKSDENEIIEWLGYRFDHLFKLWSPIS